MLEGKAETFIIKCKKTKIRSKSKLKQILKYLKSRWSWTENPPGFKAKQKTSLEVFQSSDEKTFLISESFQTEISIPSDRVSIINN